MLTYRQLEGASKCDNFSISCRDCINEKLCAYGSPTVKRELAETAITLADMLKRLEWIPSEQTYASYCRMCKWEKGMGHNPNCELAALLKGLEGSE